MLSVVGQEGRSEFHVDLDELVCEGARRILQEHKSPPAGCWAAGWCWLLGLQQPHVGGLGALRPLLNVELDSLPLIKPGSTEDH